MAWRGQAPGNARHTGVQGHWRGVWPQRRREWEDQLIGEEREEADDVGPHVSQWGERRGSRGNLDHAKIRRPASGPKSIKDV